MNALTVPDALKNAKASRLYLTNGLKYYSGSGGIPCCGGMTEDAAEEKIAEFSKTLFELKMLFQRAETLPPQLKTEVQEFAQSVFDEVDKIKASAIKKYSMVPDIKKYALEITGNGSDSNGGIAGHFSFSLGRAIAAADALAQQDARLLPESIAR